MSPKMTNVAIDQSMDEIEDSPIGETEIVASSSSLEAGGGPSGSELSVQQQSPTKLQLHEAVAYLENEVGQTKVQAEEFVQTREREIKQDALAKMQHLIADQKTQREQTTNELEQMARDEVAALVAQNKSEVVAEALSALGDRDKTISDTTSETG